MYGRESFFYASADVSGFSILKKPNTAAPGPRGRRSPPSGGQAVDFTWFTSFTIYSRPALAPRQALC